MKRALAFALLALAVPARAQTTDAYWQLWSSREERQGPRAQALGGVSVVLDNDTSAASSNPALLATLWRTEVVAGAGTTGRTDFTQLAGAKYLRYGQAVAGYVRRPVALAARGSTSRLDFELTEAGVQYAQGFGERFAFGVGVHATRLALTGESSTSESGARLRAGAGTGSTRYGASAGVVWHDHATTLGAAFHTGQTFEATRTSTRNGAWEDPGSTFQVRRPWRLAVGGTYRPTLRIAVFGQADLRGAGTLRTIAARALPAPAQGAVASAAERAGLGALRAGVQYALPFERMSVVLRAGVARLSNAGLRTSTTGAGVDTMPATTRVTAGVGLAWHLKTIDLSYDGHGRWTIEARLRLRS